MTLLLGLALLAHPVWIDTDPSIAPGGHEVDDGFALVQAFHSPEIVVRGVSVVFGNAPLDKAQPIAEAVLKLIQPATKPFRGAAAAGELGGETDASRAIEAALAKETMTILALGPVTNIATVLRNHPDLVPRIRQIVAVAGRRPGQHFTTGTKQSAPFRDFNFELDAPAFQVLLDSKVPIVLAPWEISSKVWLKSGDLDRLQSASPVLSFINQPARDWLHFWSQRFGVDGFNPFDTLAVAYVTSPELLRCQDLHAEIRELPDDVKPGASKPYLLASREIHSGRTVRYCFEATPGFKNNLMKRLIRQ